MKQILNKIKINEDASTAAENFGYMVLPQMADCVFLFVATSYPVKVAVKSLKQYGGDMHAVLY